MPSTPPDREALLLELEQGLESFRHITTLILQMLGILIAADAVLISYGVSQRESAVVLVASFIPIAIFVGMFALYSHALPIVVVVMRLEDELSLGERALGTTYARMRLASIYPLLRKAEVGDEQFIKIPIKTWLTTKPLYLLACTFALQLSLFVASLSVYHFSFM
jgi:hypothetical protein